MKFVPKKSLLCIDIDIIERNYGEKKERKENRSLAYLLLLVLRIKHIDSSKTNTFVFVKHFINFIIIIRFRLFFF